MRKRIVLALLIPTVFISVSCSRQCTITEADKASIINNAKRYYSALEEKNFKEVIELLYPEKWKIRVFELSNRGKILEELTEYLDYEVRLVLLSNEVEKNTTSFENGEIDKELYTISAKINVNYKNYKQNNLNEVLYFKKYNDKWLIKFIESGDRYIIIRSNEYYYIDAIMTP